VTEENKKQTFEEMLAELESIVGALEKGTTDLETAIKLYERGTMLRVECEKVLNEAKLKVEQLIVSSSGIIGKQEFGTA